LRAVGRSGEAAAAYRLALTDYERLVRPPYSLRITQVVRGTAPASKGTAAVKTLTPDSRWRVHLPTKDASGGDDRALGDYRAQQFTGLQCPREAERACQAAILPRVENSLALARQHAQSGRFGEADQQYRRALTHLAGADQCVWARVHNDLAWH